MSAKSVLTQFKKGTSGNPKGRPKGSRRKISEAERRELANRIGITALEHLLSILRDPEAKFRQKLDAAKAAAPYMHPKMPMAVQVEDPVDPISCAALHRLTKPELLLLRTLLEKAGVAVD